ncbi:MAG TPA: ATP-binding protein [Nevskiaceae bacterium]|nr:ATP-binding protein [Nevskiaceae bacterium]
MSRHAKVQLLREPPREEIEERFRIMADCAPVLLWMAGTDALCYFFNQPWLAFTGRTIEEEYGNGWAEGVHAEDFQNCMHVYMDSFVARKPFRMEYRLRRHDGEYRWILDQGVPRFAADGTFAGYIGSCVDITEQKDIQAELDRRVKQRTIELDAALKELEAFNYSVSHDLRAPLRAIDGFSQALLEDCSAELDGKGHDYLHRVRNAAQRMGNLIDDLLRLSRVGRAQLHHRALDLSEMARSVASDLQKTQPDRKVDWVIADGVRSAGDPSLVRAVLENLIGNAWKYTGNAAAPRIEFGAEDDHYFVQDNGAGFDMAHAAALFSPFHRLHTDAEFPGNGIGLATVQRIVHRHGGRIWAQAEKGKGARFTFTLPAPENRQESR